MPDHLTRHRAAMAQMAYPLVKDFIARHPEYAMAPDQSGSHSNTNYVIFGVRASQGGAVRVVFKVFCEDERKTREVYALHHFAATGLVPTLIAEDGARLIVQSYIPGDWPPKPGEANFNTEAAAHAGYTLGQATAKLVATPLSPQAALDFEHSFYDGLPLTRYWRDIVDAAWQVCRNVPVYQSAEFADSLIQIEAILPYILQQPRLLYHQDAMNMHFVGREFSGFFDLEMCRVGTTAMQIGALWHFLAVYQNWHTFAQGFAQCAGQTFSRDDFDAARAFAHFLTWRYVTRSGRWRGDLIDTIAPAQLSQAANDYAATIRLHNSVLFAA